MAVSLGLSITQNSQSIANNTSNITVSVIAYWTSGSWNGTAKPGTLAIDGTSYDFSSSFNTGHSNTGSQTIYTKTVDVGHSTDGTKTVACSASFITGVSSGTVYTSASKTLTTIPRKSSLNVSNGTLGTELTLTINRHSSTFSHRIRYSCGTESAYLTTDAIDGTSVTWTPPISLAAQNTSSTAVSIAFTLYTYDENGVELGTDTATITCAIPSSVVPTVSIAVSDASGYLTTYDGYIQNLSKISVTLTASGVYGSTIKAYDASADGKTYTTSSFTTDPISGSGELTITATVSDTRGRTATASTTINVIAYSAPKITAIDIYRSGASGTATSNGAYLTVKFSGSVTSINSKNTAKYVVQYKKANDTSYTSEELAAYANAYSVIDGMYTFAADTSSTYDIIFTATDAFNSAQRSGSGGTVSKLFSFLAKGLGIAFGKVAEKNKTVELEDEWSLEVGKDATIGGNASVSGTFGVTGSATFSNTIYDKNGNEVLAISDAYILEKTYPVGSYYISHNNTSPAELFGGTWYRVENQFLWACPADGTIGSTGGEQTHTLTVAEMPYHSHPILLNSSAGTYDTWDYSYGAAKANRSYFSQGPAEPIIGGTGGTGAHNNMPPYISVAIWRRTA